FKLIRRSQLNANVQHIFFNIKFIICGIHVELWRNGRWFLWEEIVSGDNTQGIGNDIAKRPVP
ncbi:MAG: hypothetical protein K2K92_09160, partial [Duncaniella sp.]|nr:hypothetical protein [Duncaniella sp.]